MSSILTGSSIILHGTMYSVSSADYTSMKTCTLCKQLKPEADFSWRSKAKGTRTSRCKPCLATLSKNHYQTNKSMYLAKAKKWNAKNFEINCNNLLTYFETHHCIDCGNDEPEVLDFDHREPSLKSFSVVDKLRTSPWASLLREIEKCDVRCANCHRKKTNKQFNYWRGRRADIPNDDNLS